MKLACIDAARIHWRDQKCFLDTLKGGMQRRRIQKVADRDLHQRTLDLASGIGVAKEGPHTNTGLR